MSARRSKPDQGAQHVGHHVLPIRLARRQEVLGDLDADAIGQQHAQQLQPLAGLAPVSLDTDPGQAAKGQQVVGLVPARRGPRAAGVKASAVMAR